MQQHNFKIEIINSWESQKWDNITSEMDIYYTNKYHRIYEKIGDGAPKLFYMESNGESIIYPFLLRKIPNTEFFDIITIYGYGGPFIKYKSINNIKELIESFRVFFTEFAEKNKIVSEFIRFHPLYKQQSFFSSLYEVENIKETIYIDTTPAVDIWNNIHTKKKNAIRKAEKAGVTVEEVSPIKYIDDFYKIYCSTMYKNSALPYYYFNKEFFNNSINLLKDNLKMFVAYFNNEIVSATLILLNKPYGHYHFSGSTENGLKVAANDLLLYKISVFLQNNGYRYFHLGGGYSTSIDDSLFRFKRRFSQKGEIPFFIGKKVYNEKIYNKLVNERQLVNDSSYFPLYRKAK